MTTAAAEDKTEEDERDELLGAEDFDAEDKLVELELFTITPPAVGMLDLLEDLLAGMDGGADVVGLGEGESEAAED